LDVIRFIAFALVFLSHSLPDANHRNFSDALGRSASILTAFHSACAFGLSLFFTLSAFLICELLLRERQNTGTIGIRQFYIRRILRIWPLYYLALFIGAIFAIATGANRSVFADLGWFAIFMGAWFSAFHGWIANQVTPLWSISIEEQFYLLAPFTARYLNRTSMYGFCAFLILLANGWLYYFGWLSLDGHRIVSDTRIWADTFVQFECFAAGILLSLALHGRLPVLAAWQRLLMVAGWCCCWMFACYGLHSRFNVIGAVENPGSLPLIAGYALASLGSVMAILAFLGLNPKSLPGWAIYFGRISFGLYVYHQFAISIMYRFIGHGDHVAIGVRFLRVGLSFGLTASMAALSYRYFETPFLKMKKKHAVIDSQPIATEPEIFVQPPTIQRFPAFAMPQNSGVEGPLSYVALKEVSEPQCSQDLLIASFDSEVHDRPSVL
jgi:peptidoglycan/LPS O-acetylase OafA/YrhL